MRVDVDALTRAGAVSRTSLRAYSGVLRPGSGPSAIPTAPAAGLRWQAERSERALLWRKREAGGSCETAFSTCAATARSNPVHSLFLPT